MTILDEIAAHTRLRVEHDKSHTSFKELQERCAPFSGIKHGCRFESVLKAPGLSFICEIKQASPSRGMIVDEFPYQEIAQEYEQAGAEAISCLTEPHWFKGSDDIFANVRATVDTPLLRKDFVIDAYQIYQAKLMGADAVLLICTLLDTTTLKQFLDLCEELGISALVETHDEAEVDCAVSLGARVIGVNNRNLKDFSVDLTTSERLCTLIPEHHIVVAESGISQPSDVAHLGAVGFDAVLVGEMMMKASDRAATLRALRRCAQ